MTSVSSLSVGVLAAVFVLCSQKRPNLDDWVEVQVMS